jgi:hypothetical protein
MMKCGTCGNTVHWEALWDNTHTQRCKAIVKRQLPRTDSQPERVVYVLEQCGEMMRKVPWAGGRFKNGLTGEHHTPVGEAGDGWVPTTTEWAVDQMEDDPGNYDYVRGFEDVLPEAALGGTDSGNSLKTA